MRLATLISLLVGGWTAISNLSAADTNAAPVSAAKVAFTNLLAHKQEYKGKRVEVTGYYSGSFESYALYETQTNGSRANSLWIDPFRDRPGYKQNVTGKRWNFHGNVRIIGTFEFEPNLGVGHMNGWPAQITSLELFEKIE